MENFIVSARKYRPQIFDTVVGQTHITSTLKNAIRTNHVAQAYLFCGPRGVGKTTCARILAKTINCYNRTENIECCDTCESCKSFNTGHSLNIYELDAASNNSVEDIRNLINQVSFAPQLGSYKVYIIDEVHMLSQAAFNAFLKTLEEPPRHAIFILATTEKHKIIPTILSRCQIFDFNRIRIDNIVSHLASISKKEKINAEEDALHIIAQKSDGSMRDALSVFDQMVTLSGESITYQMVIDNLNILDYDYYFKITDAVLEKNSSTSFLLFNEILMKGFDGHHFLNGLAEHFRNLLVCRDEITLSLLEVSASICERYKVQSQKTDTDLLLRGLSIMNKADVQYKISRNQRLLVELMLLQLCSLRGIPAVPDGPGTGEKKSEVKGLTGLSGQKTDLLLRRNPLEQEEKPNQQENNSATNTYTFRVSAQPKVAESGQNQYQKSMPSISSLTNGGSFANTRKSTNVPQDAETGSAEEKSLESVWNSFAESMKKKNKINLYSTLTSQQPFKTNNSTITFNVLNHVQDDEIQSVKTDLLLFLRHELNAPSLQLQIEVDKNEGERKPYTAEEKYKHLAEKNPAINKLRQQFHFEIDF